MSCNCNSAAIISKYRGFFTPVKKKVDPEKQMEKELKKKSKKKNEKVD